MGMVLGCVLCLAQTPKSPQSVPSPVGVHRGKSEMDNKRWTILTVPAKRPYRNFSGTAVLPELRVECIQEGDKHEFAVILKAQGPLDGVYYEGANPVYIPVKIDDAPKERHVWHELADHRSYEYSSLDPYDEANALPIDERDKAHLVFLKQILAAKTVFLKFEPLLVSGSYEIPFDVRGLKREFAKYPECQDAKGTDSRDQGR
jgi:hypothetical protein